MMILLPWPDIRAMNISDSMEVLLEESQFCVGRCRKASTWLNSPWGEES